MSSPEKHDGAKGSRKELITEFIQSMDRLFSERPSKGLLQSMNDFFSAAPFVGGGFSVETEDNHKEFIIRAIVPGVKREQIELEMLPQAVRITVSHSDSNTLTNSAAGWTQHSKAQSRSSRIIHLPASINEKAISAALKDGILQIRIPKLKGKLIEIDE
ncbi:Hsp20/alpha crystallin family protein [Peribacillus sp. SCS-155]|uniref:Hsp20/alpha crystallin family protein n=1 Tax=Peribacillus sedimenti TaxID=3115297 RepID=UPI0039065B74